MRLLWIVLSVLSFSSLTACTQNPEWTLFYYPDVKEVPVNSELSAHISGYYATAEQCLLKGSGLARLSHSGTGSYQCGHQCVADEAKGLSCKMLVEKPGV